MADGRLILLCGLPGAGKTTLARRLAGELRAVRFCPDEWMADLGMDLYDVAARDRLERKLWQLTRELLPDLTVILEYGFWGRDERDEKRLYAREVGVPVELRFLDVPFEELMRRVQIRNGTGDPSAPPLTYEMVAGSLALFQAPDAAELAMNDEPAAGAGRRS
jgi:predicted kinase